MELRDPGGCNNPCTVFRNNQFCCTSGNICEPTSYSEFFRDLCRVAFTYPSDFSQRASCPTGTDYNVTFCPTTIDKKTNNSPQRRNKTGAAQIGVCYTGLLGYLSAEYDVIPLYKQYNISRIRLYNPDNTTLQAL
ncbi:hypothetical protein L484_023753 [Morus notabilis]|uniref:Thaumatin-like protein n=1 Tax=Morus notabilis TaxID=981085 RepID=W9QR43_9ROSA|nr:hypothetical protein L484_023753 [Morus notabilis]